MSRYTGKPKPRKLRSRASRAHSGQAVDGPPEGIKADGRQPGGQVEVVRQRLTHARRHAAAPGARPVGAVHVRVPSAPKAPHNGAVRRQAAYLRVSTPKQSEALQRDAISRAAAARGETVDLWFAEKMGGQRSDRPELESVRDLARRGEISELWVFRLDRLARGAVFLLNVVQELKNYGCRVVALDVPGDLEGPWAPAILAVLGTAAEIELEAIRDRTAAARAKAEAAGKRWGRPLGPTEDRSAELEILLECIDRDGMSLRQAAELTGLSYGTAQRMVSAVRQAQKEPDATGS